MIADGFLAAGPHSLTAEELRERWLRTRSTALNRVLGSPNSTAVGTFGGVLFRDSASHDAICWSVPYSPRALSSPTQDRIAVSSLLDIAEETSRTTESIATSLHSLTVGKVR